MFLLFFGVALLAALRSHGWPRDAFRIAVGRVFPRGDLMPRRRQHERRGRHP